MIAYSSNTLRFPPLYQDMNIFEMQNKVIESILGDVAQQEIAAIGNNKPVAEEQTLVSQVL